MDNVTKTRVLRITVTEQLYKLLCAEARRLNVKPYDAARYILSRALIQRESELQEESDVEEVR
jgi:hypothetical protein